MINGLNYILLIKHMIFHIIIDGIYEIYEI